MITEEQIVQLITALPGAVHDDTAFVVEGKGFAWFYAEKIEGRKGRVLHDDVLAVCVASLEEKELLLAADPAKFFTDAHYRGFRAVLVRLGIIEEEELLELLTEAWRLKAPRRVVKAFDLLQAHQQVQ